ncbi:sulfurtransferase [Tsukamurella pseudospumae]|uniref:Sulfurtransferase n=1 Tax=Tsukamurella pseudospumae TaxID=239498 RepID=A0A138ABF5_9ACTN|nr:sulfurtransferase [Tsukamurella pseudospumae]KXP07841.1 sulfurtransferase [Tsukamurella pseudospumae]
MIEPFVDAAWVRANPGVILADTRCYLDGRSTREAYDAGHLPGAVYVDLDGYLAAPASPEAGRHPLPTPEAFAAGLSAAGIGDGATVVAYDDAGGVMAARLVWLLRSLGEDAALLDGPLGPLDDTGTVVPSPATFTPRPWPADRLATIDEASAGAVPVIDARPADRFRGENETVDPRAGHIPGAVSVPCRDNVVDGALLPVPELRDRFEAAGLRPGEDFVAYCGSGVSACHNLLTAEHAGFDGGRLYPGSWSQYAGTDRPAATGA